jgi:hypothetical protein
MGLEPTTPCLQTKMSRTRGDADRQKVLVRVGVLRCVDPLGRPRMFPKCSLVASRARYDGVKRQPAGSAAESGPVTHCLQVANAVDRLKDGPVIPQRSPASPKPSDGKAGHPGRKPEPYETFCQADDETVGEGDPRSRWVRPRERRVVLIPRKRDVASAAVRPAVRTAIRDGVPKAASVTAAGTSIARNFSLAISGPGSPVGPRLPTARTKPTPTWPSPVFPHPNAVPASKNSQVVSPATSTDLLRRPISPANCQIPIDPVDAVCGLRFGSATHNKKQMTSAIPATPRSAPWPRRKSTNATMLAQNPMKETPTKRCPCFSTCISIRKPAVRGGCLHLYVSVELCSNAIQLSFAQPFSHLATSSPTSYFHSAETHDFCHSL